MIQQHINVSTTFSGSNSFNRSWKEYELGFGDAKGDYWIGNHVLTWLTENGDYKLTFELQPRNTSKWYYAEFSTFIVLSDAHNYKLQVAGYKGNVGLDSFSRHSEMMFTTYDRDNDQWSSGNCAGKLGGGFWYNDCYTCGVNNAPNVFNWIGLSGGRPELLTSRMWLQCK